MGGRNPTTCPITRCLLRCAWAGSWDQKWSRDPNLVTLMVKFRHSKLVLATVSNVHPNVDHFFSLIVLCHCHSLAGHPAPQCPPGQADVCLPRARALPYIPHFGEFLIMSIRQHFLTSIYQGLFLRH